MKISCETKIDPVYYLLKALKKIRSVIVSKESTHIYVGGSFFFLFLCKRIRTAKIYLLSSTGAAAATGAPAAAGPAAPPTGADAILDKSSSMFCPLRAFANIAGQKASTSFPLALMTLESLSPYT